MRILGLALLTLGFLGGAWVASQHPTDMNWTWYVPAFAVGVIGVVVARIGAGRAARDGSRLADDVDTLVSSIDRIVERLDAFVIEARDMHPYDLHAAIDERFTDDRAAFAESRQSLAHVHGLQAYAEVMNAFAAGERYMNRVWSASVDGYVDECAAFLGRAQTQFTEARRLLTSLEAGRGR